jgi:hypothetical protein
LWLVVVVVVVDIVVDIVAVVCHINIMSERNSARDFHGYDSEDEPLTEEQEERMNWRLDPEESYSDWSIQINYLQTSENDKITTANSETYHVHKNVLGVGPRKSEYFLRLFQSGESFTESKSKTSRIELEEIAAKAFPQMLDYLYWPEKELHVTAETATALHHLGSYFEMRRLRWDARQFWKKDLNIENCDIYYEQALLLHDDKIRTTVAKICTENIKSISPESRIIKVSDDRLWEDILKESWGPTYHLSTLLAAFCSNYEGIDADSFLKLTDEELLPDIDFTVAQKFIGLENKIIDKSCEVKLSSLGDRCIRSLAESWADIQVDREDTFLFLKQQSPLLLAELVTKSLAGAQDTYKNLEREQKRLETAHRRLETRCAQAERQRDEYLKERDEYRGILERFSPVTKLHCAKRDPGFKLNVTAEKPSHLPKKVPVNLLHHPVSIPTESGNYPIYFVKPP